MDHPFQHDAPPQAPVGKWWRTLQIRLDALELRIDSRRSPERGFVRRGRKRVNADAVSGEFSS